MKTEKDMQHGMKWNGEDVTDWIATEKFRGVRAYWDGAEMWTRGGLRVDLPQSWRDELPVGVELDGEVYCGPDGERAATDAVCHGRFKDGTVFIVFDIPTLGKAKYVQRIEAARALLSGSKNIQVVEWGFLWNTDDALEMMRSIQSYGGEGVVARHNSEPYRPGRSRRILKFKEEQAKDNFSLRDVDEIIATLK